MKKIVFIILLNFLFNFSKSQTISNEIISSCGNSFSVSTYQIDFTVSDIIIETFSNQNLTLTQGFQQGNLFISEVIENNNSQIEIIAFPNPTTNKITLDFKENFHQIYNCIIFDLNGKILFDYTIDKNIFEIDFSNYSCGVYYLTINKNLEIIKSFKIVKN